MSVALITLATGPVYHNYANGMVASSHKFWPEAQTIVFTDSPYSIKGSDMCVYTEPKGYPGETLYRYHTFLKSEGLLRKFDHVFYCDADMLWVAPAGDEMIGSGLTATLHPGFIGTRGTPETRIESRSFCNTNTAYYCGGFQGGQTDAYLSAAKWMMSAIDEDAKNGITPIWHDESAFNKYLTVVFPTTVLSPSFCYPEGYRGQWGWKPEAYVPILMALDKHRRGNHPRQVDV